MVDERWAFVALALVPGIGAGTRRYHDLLNLGPPASVLRESGRALAAGAGGDVAARLRGFDAEGAAMRQAEAAVRLGATLVVLGDPEYPAALAGIPEAPPFLLVRGRLGREDALAVAVVGSRQATGYGLRMAARLGTDLGARGVTVVSGLARGVDTAAHRGALDGGGRTVAVFGCGLDVVYPAENRPLVERVVAAGAAVSQFPMGTRPMPGNFPMRNRVIAGLTLGTVVVEAAERSGALITARFAGELGREVYAVPGNVSSAVSAGTNRLIQDGAKLVGGWEDVVAEWPPTWREALRPGPGPDLAAGVPPGGADTEERQLLALLGDEPVPIDAVIERSGASSGQVAAGLVRLELQGLVRQLPGQRYARR
ncbi:MAG TPA: DNA-processing protein DprA [Methylomirabilota bacterium]|nr:DNA-processing protein DprA [Methylomirabilota bacterium]